MRNPFAVAIQKFQEMSNAQRLLVMALAAILCLVALQWGNRPAMKQVPGGTMTQAPLASGDFENDPYRANDVKQLRELQENAAATRTELQAQIGRDVPMPVPPMSVSSPLIAHTAELAVATKEFARSRTSLEEILERHRGYAAKLRMVGQKNGSVLSATLRVPSTELVGTVSDLKALGDVEREEQAADEITQQRADLDARLSNARGTLRRLQELLQKQTYPDGNVRELQRQIASASAEVARLEAEQQASEHRVIFANVYFTMREELAAPSESLGAQLRGAGEAGLGAAMTSLAGLLVFLIGRGPVVLLWCLILWLPARWIWRRLATQAATMAQEA